MERIRIIYAIFLSAQVCKGTLLELAKKLRTVAVETVRKIQSKIRSLKKRRIALSRMAESTQASRIETLSQIKTASQLTEGMCIKATITSSV